MMTTTIRWHHWKFPFLWIALSGRHLTGINGDTAELWWWYDVFIALYENLPKDPNEQKMIPIKNGIMATTADPEDDDTKWIKRYRWCLSTACLRIFSSTKTDGKSAIKLQNPRTEMVMAIVNASDIFPWRSKWMVRIMNGADVLATIR